MTVPVFPVIGYLGAHFEIEHIWHFQLLGIGSVAVKLFETPPAKLQSLVS